MKTRQSSGTAKAPKAIQQSVIVKVDRSKYRKVRQILIGMDLTVAWLIRNAIDEFIEEHTD